MSGIDALLPSVRTLANGRLGFIAQSGIGLTMLVCAVRAPASATAAPRVEPSASTYGALALLGVTATALELPTAVPYFGAIALLTAADLPMARWLPLLVIYNAIFVLRPCCSSSATSCWAGGSRHGTATSAPSVGARCTASYRDLIHLVHLAGSVFAWEISSPAELDARRT